MTRSRAAAEDLVRIEQHLAPLSPSTGWQTRLLKAADRSADPDLAIRSTERCIAAAADAPDAPDALALWADPAFLRRAVPVLAAAPHLADLLCSTPAIAVWLWEADRWKRRHSVTTLLAEWEANAPPTDRWREPLAAFKARHDARIAFADLAAGRALTTVTAEISDLAEATVRIALAAGCIPQRVNNNVGRGLRAPPLLDERRAAGHEPEARRAGDGGRLLCRPLPALRAGGGAFLPIHPLRHTPQAAEPLEKPFCVLALGKLGGRELNYSSDIDLIFLTANNRSSEQAEQQTARAQALIAALSVPIGHEHLYRVDMRLRPYGTSGPLVVTLDAGTTYYESHCSPWELQALLKARPIAGDLAVGRRFLAAVRPLVCPRYPKARRIRSIQAIKRRIEAETSRRGEALTEVKTGVGGIRDIEFMIQFLQMLHGGRVPAIVTRNSLRALTLLEREGFLTADEADRAREAYRFLRTVEHRLQLMHALQTHRLPDSERELARLARRVGVGERDDAASARAFRAAYAHRTADARAILNTVFHHFIAAKSDEVDEIAAALIDPAYPEERITELIAAAGFADPVAGTATLLRLTRNPSRFASPSSRRTRHYLAAIAPALLTALAASPAPDMALLNLERCTEQYGARATFYQLLAETPQALSLFVDLCGASQFLSDRLIANPTLLDPVIDALQTGLEKSAAQMADELTESIALLGEIGPAVEDHYDREILRIGIRDIQEKSNVRNVMEEITDLAESIVVGLCRALVPDDETVDLVVVALGSLGSREMVYSSDLDLMFLFQNDARLGPGEAVAAGSGFAQRLIQACSGLYQVDPRLRPAGRAGALATSVSTFVDYFTTRADLWEFVMLTRARPIAGPEPLCRLVASEIGQSLRVARDRFDIVKEGMAMRGKLIEAAGPNDIKRGRGGLVDIEFAVSMLQLLHGPDRPAIFKPNSVEAILALHEAGLLSDADRGQLLTAYQFFRFVESRLRIVHNIPGDRIPDAAPEIVALSRRLGYDSRTARDDFLAELRYHRAMTEKSLFSVAKAESR